MILMAQSHTHLEARGVRSLSLDENGGKMGYDWTQTAGKAIWIFIFGGLGSLLGYLANLPQSPTIVLVTMLLVMAQNWLKNKD